MRTRPPRVRANNSLGEPFDRHLVILGFIQRGKEGIRSFILSKRSLSRGAPPSPRRDKRVAVGLTSKNIFYFFLLEKLKKYRTPKQVVQRERQCEIEARRERNRQRQKEVD